MLVASLDAVSLAVGSVVIGATGREICKVFVERFLSKGKTNGNGNGNVVLPTSHRRDMKDLVKESLDVEVLPALGRLNDHLLDIAGTNKEISAAVNKLVVFAELQSRRN